MPAWPERLLRIGGLVVGIALAAITAVWEAVLTPTTAIIGGSAVHLPVSVLVAILANVGIVWFTYQVTGRVGFALVPGIAWFVVMVAAATPTSERDLVITGDNWVGIVTILVGSLAWAVTAYRLILRPVRAGAKPLPAKSPR